MTAICNDPPHRRQNLRSGSLPSPHCEQTRSPGLISRVGAIRARGVGRDRTAVGFTASGCTGATAPVAGATGWVAWALPVRFGAPGGGAGTGLTGGGSAGDPAGVVGANAGAAAAGAAGVGGAGPAGTAGLRPGAAGAAAAGAASGRSGCGGTVTGGGGAGADNHGPVASGAAAGPAALPGVAVDSATAAVAGTVGVQAVPAGTGAGEPAGPLAAPPPAGTGAGEPGGPFADAATCGVRLRPRRRLRRVSPVCRLLLAYPDAILYASDEAGVARAPRRARPRARREVRVPGPRRLPRLTTRGILRTTRRTCRCPHCESHNACRRSFRRFLLLRRGGPRPAIALLEACWPRRTGQPPASRQPC